MSTPDDSVPKCADDAPAPETAADAAELARAPRYTRMSLRELDLLARLHAHGTSYRDMAVALGRSTHAISDGLRRLRQTPDLTRALLTADALPALQDWRKARKVAAKRGDHRPAKEWLESGQPELRPVTAATASASAAMTIVIGTPQAPLALPTLDAVTVPAPPARDEP